MVPDCSQSLTSDAIPSVLQAKDAKHINKTDYGSGVGRKGDVIQALVNVNLPSPTLEVGPLPSAAFTVFLIFYFLVFHFDAYDDNSMSRRLLIISARSNPNMSGKSLYSPCIHGFQLPAQS